MDDLTGAALSTTLKAHEYALQDLGQLLTALVLTVQSLARSVELLEEGQDNGQEE